MKPRISALLASFVLAFAPALSAADNQLTAKEKADGWQLLFDGKSLQGWRVYAKKDKPIAGWEISNGTLRSIATPKGSKAIGDQIITEKKYDNFELSWEWKLPKAGNNGIKYFVTEARTKSPGHEYQMLDDAAHPDAKHGEKRQTASFYEVLAPAPNKPLKPIGEWNHSKIVVRGNTVEHWLNGRNVLTYECGSEAVKAGVAQSKFKNDAGFGDKIVGHIMLTYHNDDCWYRNIKIRELK